MTEADDSDGRPTVAAVVPAYQPGPNLTALVSSLVQQTARVVVVDDGSPTSADLLETVTDLGADLVRHETNRGIAAALNTGIHAVTTGGQVRAVLTVDQDSEVPDGYVAALLQTWAEAERTELQVGLVAPAHVAGLPDQRTGRVPVQSGLLIPTATLQRVGEFDESLVIDGVDDDFGLRCLDAGLALVVAEGVRLGHRLGETHNVSIAGRTITVTRSAPFRYYYLTRNRIRLVRRHGRRQPLWAISQTVGLWGHLLLVQALLPGRRERWRQIARGLRDGVDRSAERLS